MNKSNYLVYVAENVGDNPERGFKYVGKTNHMVDRKYRHRKAGERGSQNDFHVAIHKWGWESFEWSIDRDGMLEWEALDHEIELIAHLDTFLGDGYNMTPGGDGLTECSDEMKKRIGDGVRKAYSDPAVLQNMKEKVKEACNDPEYRKRLSNRLKAVCNTPEHRAKMSRVLKVAMQDEELRRKLSDSANKRWSDPEQRRKASDAAKERMKNPELRNKISKANKKAYSDPAVLQNMKEKVKEACNDPEYRKRLSKKLKVAMNRPEVRQRLSDAAKERMKNPDLRRRLSITKGTPVNRQLQEVSFIERSAQGYWN